MAPMDNPWDSPETTPLEWLSLARRAWAIEPQTDDLTVGVADVLDGLADMVDVATGDHHEEKARAIALRGLADLRASIKKWTRRHASANAGNPLALLSTVHDLLKHRFLGGTRFHRTSPILSTAT
jgi:hypothetical protein